MINFPTEQEVKELKSFNEPFCVSIYVPHIEIGGPINPNRIELKNLLGEAEDALLKSGASPPEVRKTLAPAWKLVEDHEFWPVHREDLALFLHPKLSKHFHIPGHYASRQVAVKNGFDLEPLSKSMEDNTRYFVLALGHKNVRLFEGDHYDLKPVHLKNFPTDMHRALMIDEFPHSRETHTIAPASTGKGSEAFHEQYNVAQTDKEMLLEFFRRIDRSLHGFLFKQRRPLIIAGVTNLLAMYRKVNTYPGLLAGAIKGNQDHSDLRSIREKAWPLAKKSLAKVS